MTGPDSSPSIGTLSDAWGLIPRSLHYLYSSISSRADANYSVKSAYLEIHNEHVRDLLNPSATSLPVRWSAKQGFYVENLFVVECEVLDDSLAVLEEGLRNRRVAAHDLNEYSSRSHAIMTIFVEAEWTDPDDGRVLQRHGKISFVDLAGSEKVKETKSKGDMLVETLNINKSLLALGQCIAALGDPKKRGAHVPYRDSKLTKLLADSLGGDGVALMIACVTPSAHHSAESINTLRYASRARYIRNKPVVHMDQRDLLIARLRQEVQLLRSENAYLRSMAPGGLLPPLPIAGTSAPVISVAPVSVIAPPPPSLFSPTSSHGHSPSGGGSSTLPPLAPAASVAGRSSAAAMSTSSGSSPRSASPAESAHGATATKSSSAGERSQKQLLREYMLANENLRAENAELQASSERFQYELALAMRENDQLLRKLEYFETIFEQSIDSALDGPASVALGASADGDGVRMAAGASVAAGTAGVGSTTAAHYGRMPATEKLKAIDRSISRVRLMLLSSPIPGLGAGSLLRLPAAAVGADGVPSGLAAAGMPPPPPADGARGVYARMPHGPDVADGPLHLKTVGSMPPVGPGVAKVMKEVHVSGSGPVAPMSGAAAGAPRPTGRRRSASESSRVASLKAELEQLDSEIMTLESVNASFAHSNASRSSSSTDFVAAGSTVAKAASGASPSRAQGYSSTAPRGRGKR
jgi:hypothetical protein